jgi:hypothetical protein
MNPDVALGQLPNGVDPEPVPVREGVHRDHLEQREVELPRRDR